ncbi:MAG: GNAT family N-acetyltransferase [Candidatus Lokiarchaeota archaeon]|nr:GNAT family N-acetyltransferase [Candidatus Lokiarchaeota archaeon]
MTIRKVKIKEAPIIARIAANCSPSMRPSVEGTYEYLARCFSNTFFVYEKDDEIIGFIVGFPNTAELGEFWIYQCGILNKWRGKGIGSELFTAIFDAVKAEGYKSIRSHYKFSNTHSANLHKKFGMEICGQDERGYFVEIIFNND